VQFGYEKKLSDKFSFDGYLTYNTYKDRVSLDWLFAGFFGVQNIQAESYEAELNGYYNPSKNLSITLGELSRCE